MYLHYLWHNKIHASPVHGVDSNNLVLFVLRTLHRIKKKLQRVCAGLSGEEYENRLCSDEEATQPRTQRNVDRCVYDVEVGRMVYF